MPIPSLFPKAGMRKGVSQGLPLRRCCEESDRARACFHRTRSYPTFPFRNATGFLVQEPTSSSSLYLVVLHVRHGRRLADDIYFASESCCATTSVNCDIWQFMSVLLLSRQMVYRKSAMDVYSTVLAPDPSPTMNYPGGTKIAS